MPDEPFCSGRRGDVDPYVAPSRWARVGYSDGESIATQNAFRCPRKTAYFRKNARRA